MVPNRGQVQKDWRGPARGLGKRRKIKSNIKEKKGKEGERDSGGEKNPDMVVTNRRGHKSSTHLSQKQHKY